MEQGVKELMALLKAFVHEVPLSKEEMQEIDATLPQVLYFARLHNVTGIWAYKVQEYYTKNPPSNEEEQEVFDVAQKIFSHTVARGTERGKCYQILSKALCEKGIDHLAFKGIVVKDIYPVPELRTFGDVDFAIRNEDRERCHALMQELHYEVPVAYEPVYTYRKNEEVYEVHTVIMTVNITDRADFIEYFQDLWKHAVLQENHVWNFSLDFHFVYLLAHIGKHIYSSGAGIRMYLDLALYIHKLGDTMDWNLVLEEIKKLELTQFFYLTLKSLNCWFGLELPISIPEQDDELLEEFYTFTMESGVFGHEGRKSGVQLVRISGGEKGVRTKALKTIFFPSASMMEKRYDYLKKHPWLLPVAWVERLFRNVGKLRLKAEETKDIITLKRNEIQKNKNFYCRIGL